MLSMIAAMGRNRVIGRDGSLPWRLRDDLRLFKEHTRGHCVVMGRKTWETLEEPLPNRSNIVLTRQPHYDPGSPDAIVVSDPDHALARCQGDDEPFIVGGGEIYRLFLPHATRIYLSLVELEPEGDATFPELGEDWILVSEKPFPQDERNEAAFRFQIYQRRAGIR